MAPIPRKTLFLTHAVEFGGAELSLLEILERIDRERVEPVLGCFSEGPIIERVEALGIRVEKIEAPDELVEAGRWGFDVSAAGLLKSPSSLFRLLPVILKTADLVDREQAQVVYTNSSKAHIVGGFAGRRAGVPVLWHYRDYPFSQAARMLFAGLSTTLATEVICNSRFTSGQFGLTRNVRVVPNGLPVEKVKAGKPPEAVREEFGVGDAEMIIGAAGRLDRWKGMHTFIKAAADVAREYPGAVFLIVGGPIYGSENYEKELKDLAEKQGLSNKIIFTGFREDIFDVMNTFDIYVHPSEQAEPFGRGIVEAMLLGKPVVAPRAGGPLEIVLEGETGVFFEPGDAAGLGSAIDSFAENPGRMSEFGRNGRLRAKKYFSAERCVEGVTRIILEQKKVLRKAV